MKLINSLLLGTAAGLVAVSASQAADLPTRKGPVAAEYVRVCSITVAGVPVVGFVLPGSDTCFKISGYISGQMEGGNVRQQYAVAPGATAAAPASRFQAIVPNSTFTRDEFGWSTRFNLTLDAVSNTAYGPLVAHGEYQFNHGTGFDTLAAQGSDGGLNRAYVTWAGLTAGKANSFFSFTGGGYGYANFFSADRQGFNQPDLLAYTASFGGGFAATISLESEGPAYFGTTNVGGTAYPSVASAGSEQQIVGGAWGGQRFPDIVGALSVHQAWGMAQISGVAHNVRATSNAGFNNVDTWGYAFDAGVQFNIPSLPGSQIGVTGSWSRKATWYSGLPDAMWDGTPNDNGQVWTLGDLAYNPNGTIATPTAWSVTAYGQAVVNPTVTLQLEGSYGQINWNGTSATSMLSDSKGFLIGGIAHYDPVKNLDFEVELLYMNTTTAQPSGYLVGNGVTTTNTWQSKSDGFAARFQVTRAF